MPIQSVFILFHEVPYDVTNVLGTYSTNELAIEAKGRAVNGVGTSVLPQEEDLRIYEFEIDKDNF